MMQQELNKIISTIEVTERKYARGAQRWFWVHTLMHLVTLIGLAAAGAIPLLVELEWLKVSSPVLSSLSFTIAVTAQLIGQSNGLLNAWTRCKNTQINLETLRYKVERRRVEALTKEGDECLHDLGLITKYAYNGLIEIIEINRETLVKDMRGAAEILSSRVEGQTPSVGGRDPADSS